MTEAAAGDRSPRLVTVYGRMPVLEALRDPRTTVDRVLIARTARGGSVDDIVGAASQRGVAVQRVSATRVTRLSRNGRHDQGVVADIAAPDLAELDAWLERRPVDDAGQLVVLDGVTNPSNVGMVIRAVAGAGLTGLVLPRTGCPDVGPMIIKASAGTALRTPILRCTTAASGIDTLLTDGWDVSGMRGDGGRRLWDAPIAPRAAIVLGNETNGISAPVAARIERWISIPLAPGVDSLNVATAAAVISYELLRRRETAS